MSIPFQISLLDTEYEVFQKSCFLHDCIVSFEMRSAFRMFLQHLVSNAWILGCSSAVNLQDSQAYRIIENANACNSLIFNFWQMFLPFKMVLSFVTAATVCVAFDIIFYSVAFFADNRDINIFWKNVIRIFGLPAKRDCFMAETELLSV